MQRTPRFRYCFIPDASGAGSLILDVSCCHELDGGVFVCRTVKRILRLVIGVALGSALLVGGIWFLIHSLGNDETLYRGKPIAYWAEQSAHQQPALSNQAMLMLNGVIIPHLTNQMFSDTNDSRIRMALIDQLNGLPGVHITFVPQEGRRVQAINDLGSLGPKAKAAAPALLQALECKDDVLCGPAASALVKIQAEPDRAIPLLIGCLLDREGRGRPDVVEALGEFGPKAGAAVPMLVKLLADRSSKDIMAAVPTALKNIDPDAAAKAGVK